MRLLYRYTGQTVYLYPVFRHFWKAELNQPTITGTIGKNGLYCQGSIAYLQFLRFIFFQTQCCRKQDHVVQTAVTAPKDSVGESGKRSFPLVLFSHSLRHPFLPFAKNGLHYLHIGNTAPVRIGRISFEYVNKQEEPLRRTAIFYKPTGYRVRNLTTTAKLRDSRKGCVTCSLADRISIATFIE